MGNRGTTPSWDDEQIALYGLFGHMDNVRRGYRMREVSRKKARRRNIKEDLKRRLDSKREERSRSKK